MGYLCPGRCWTCKAACCCCRRHRPAGRCRSDADCSGTPSPARWPSRGLSAGSSRAARIEMIEITTSSSMRVKQQTGEARCRMGDSVARGERMGEIRNPRAETRRKVEIRNPKGGCRALVAGIVGHSSFGFRVSFGPRVSDFGFSAPNPRRNLLARNCLSGGGCSSPAEGAAVLHGLLQLFQQRRQFRFALRRSLAIERLKTDAPHLGFQFGAQHGWRIWVAGFAPPSPAANRSRSSLSPL